MNPKAVPQVDGAHARLVSADPAARTPAPDGVWDYNNYLAWRDRVWALMDDVLDSRVRREFLKRPPKYVVSDDLSWLDDIIVRATGGYEDIKALTADRLADEFHSIRTCHGTRTVDVEAYYRAGLLPLDPEIAHAKMKAVFLAGDYPELDDAALEAAIQNLGSRFRAGRVYFECNEQDLIATSGHYLLYGSEYLTALAVRLGHMRDYRLALRKVGRPTMFVCDMPRKLIDGHIMLEFAGGALESMFENLLDEDYEPDPHRGAGFCIYRPLPAEAIVGHYHPARIPDPFFGHRVLKD